MTKKLLTFDGFRALTESANTVKVAVRDARKAQEVVRDRLKDDEYSTAGSDVYVLPTDEAADELREVLREAGVEVLEAKSGGEARSLSEIAAEIRRDWPNPYFGAVPYLKAMSEMDSIDQMYGQDPGSSIVAYFLSNATKWRGETAKRVKKELNAMLKRAYESLHPAVTEGKMYKYLFWVDGGGPPFDIWAINDADAFKKIRDFLGIDNLKNVEVQRATGAPSHLTGGRTEMNVEESASDAQLKKKVLSAARALASKTDEKSAHAFIVAMTDYFGAAWHLDTPAADYVNLGDDSPTFTPAEQKAVDAAVGSLFDAYPEDPYAVVLDYWKKARVMEAADPTGREVDLWEHKDLRRHVGAALDALTDLASKTDEKGWGKTLKEAYDKLDDWSAWLMREKRRLGPVVTND